MIRAFALDMYKKGSSSSALDAVEESLVGINGFGAVAFDGLVAGEEGSEEPLGVEEPMDENFVRRKERLDPELSEPGDAGWSVMLELEEAHGLGVGCMSQ